MTEQSQHRCTECKLAMRKEKIWWVCKRNCVQRNNTDVCIMKPDQFEKGSSFKTEREKVLDLVACEINDLWNSHKISVEVYVNFIDKIRELRIQTEVHR